MMFWTMSVKVVLLTWLLFVAFFNSIPVEAALSFQRTITISNTSGSTQTNFQIYVNINTASLITTSKMRSDCGDARFFDTDNVTPLNNYWVDNCNSTTTRIWVKIPTIAIGTSTIFLKYGDSSLTSLSSGANTMERYDTFQTTPTCTLRNSAFYDSVNKWVRLTPSTIDTSGQCEYNYDPGQGFYAKYDFWSGGGDGADASWLYAYENITPTSEDVRSKGYHFTYDEYQDRICFTKSNTDNGGCIASSGTVSNIDNSTWHTAEIFHSDLFANVLMDGVSYASGSDSSATNKSSNRFGIGARTGGLFNEHRIRSFIVAKYLTAVTATLNPETQINTSLGILIRNSADTANINTCDFGDVDSSATGSCAYRLKVSTDAASGYIVSVQTSGNLNNGSRSIVNAAVGTGGAGGTLISVATLGLEAYGALINSGSITAAGSITRANAYNAGATNAVNYTTTSNQNLATSTGRNSPLTTDTTNTILVTHLLNVTPDTDAGLYTQTITYTVVASY